MNSQLDGGPVDSDKVAAPPVATVVALVARSSGLSTDALHKDEPLCSTAHTKVDTGAEDV
eukprot:1543358-Pleurochrysis_carterae.AAC.5